jgi:hypothetical protein
MERLSFGAKLIRVGDVTRQMNARRDNPAVNIQSKATTKSKTKLATKPFALLSQWPRFWMMMNQNSCDGQAGTIFFFGSAGHSSHSATGGFGFLLGFRACQRYCMW